MTSACHDAGLSDEKRVQAVSTTAVANAEELSTLGADAMHATIPLEKASFRGRGRLVATPCGPDESEGIAVPPAAADVTDWGEGLLRPLCYQGRLPRSDLRLLDILVKPTPACYRLVDVVESPLGPRRHVRQVQAGGMVAPVPGALRVALCRPRKAQVAMVVACRARGGGQLVAFPRGWRELASTRPRVRWGLVRLLLCANRRVHALGW